MRPIALKSASALGARGPRPEVRAIPGSEKAPLPGAYIVGRPNPSRCIDVTVLLRPHPAKPALASVDELGAKMPHERQHLTREAFASAHGADPEDVRRVVQFARQHGLQVLDRNLAARTIHLFGKIARFSRAFGVTMSVYRFARGYYRGRTGPVHVPLALDGIVQGVFGLDNRPPARPHFRHKRELGGVWANALSFSYPASEVAKLYDFPQGINGAGQCIAIIELGGGYTARDLNLYFHGLGIPMPQVTPVAVAGGGNRPTGNPNGPDAEVMLDIEVAGAVASGAKIVVYFAPNTDQGFLRAVIRAVHDQVHRPSVISISWGGAETSWTQQSLNAFNQAFQAAGAMGVSVCVAAGDGGSSDRVPGRLAHVDFPASSPFALACGGTSLQASGGVITSESVWNDGPQGGAGGGGVSDFFPLPAWQTNAGVPHSVNLSGHVGRGLPDLAGNADENTGYEVRVDGVDTVIGGTSAVAPLTAGLIAVLNEALGTSVGYLNPLLYSKLGTSPAFRDITEGNNDMTGLVGGYKAGPGWDACSGFGSPDGNILLANLQGPKQEHVTLREGALAVSSQVPQKDDQTTKGTSAPEGSAAPKRIRKARTTL